MNKILLLLAIAITTIISTGNAQHTFTNGNNSLQISGTVSAYYNQRFLKEGELDKKNNRFNLRDIQMGFVGRSGKTWEYKLRVDFADLIQSLHPDAALDPENPGLMSAYVEYTGLPVNIKLGYDKLPYSQGSMLSFEGSAFWQRGQLLRGDFFSCRDAGLTLSTSLWKQRIHLYGGVYTGLGESIIGNNDSDPSGNPEYIGRADIAYPASYDYVESDIVDVPVPMVRLGANVRYTNKSQPEGEELPANVAGDYGLRVIDGKRLAYGFDASFQYRCFSMQFEAQMMRLQPKDTVSSLFYHTAETVNKGYVKAGGWQAQVNYYCHPVHSVLSLRWENYNLNDLVSGETQRLGVAYSYLFDHYNVAFKIHYYKIMNEDTKLESLKWTDQIRVGVQYSF